MKVERRVERDERREALFRIEHGRGKRSGQGEAGAVLRQ